MIDFGELILETSAHPEHAGKELSWMTPDTKSNFSVNLRFDKKRKLLERNGWVDTPIKYKFNKYGFRCNEFDCVPNIVFLGCSYTLGMGVNLEDTFSAIVAKELGLENYNLAQAGGSNDSAFRISNYWIPLLEPKIVVIMNPNDDRIEIVQKNSTTFNIIPRYHQEQKKFYKLWLSNHTNGILNKSKNTKAIQQLCYENNVKDFYRFDAMDIEFVRKDVGRDIDHFGVKTHQGIAENILTTIRGT